MALDGQPRGLRLTPADRGEHGAVLAVHPGPRKKRKDRLVEPGLRDAVQRGQGHDERPVVS